MVTERNRRSELRIRPKQTVFVDYQNFLPRVRDLSLSGSFVEDPRPLRPGRILEMKLWLGEKEPLAIRGMIRRVVPGQGMGVEFLSMSEADRQRLRTFIAVPPSSDALSSASY